MPRYYFHMFSDVTCLDKQGTEFPDAEAAVTHARDRVVSVIAEMVKETRKITLSHHIDIEDDDGAPVARVRFADVVEVSH